MSAISNISASFLQSVLSSARQGATTTAGTSTAQQTVDSQHLSPLTQVLSRLQQLQQSDPAKYQQVTQQISANLQTAAQTAQSAGNSTAAADFTKLSADFSAASKSGDLPNIQDLAGAIGKGGHHRHHHVAASPTTPGSDPTSADSNGGLSQLMAALQVNAPQNDADPTSIILKTLSDAGITAPNAS